MSGVTGIDDRDELIRLYRDESKHSNYQSMPQFVVESTGLRAEIEQGWRGDRCRYRWLSALLASLPSGARCCDLGANTGFFSLSIAHDHPSYRITAIEANPNHAALIERVAEITGIKNLKVLNSKVSLRDLELIGDFDMMLHLNVLHHAGSDFDQGLVQRPRDFQSYARRYLAALTNVARLLVFQSGTNLWGDKSQPIVRYEDDVGRFRFFADLLRAANWNIRGIAYARKVPGESVEYQSLCDTFVASLRSGLDPSDRELREVLEPYNLTEHVGEFYRRAMYVCSRDD